MGLDFNLVLAVSQVIQLFFETFPNLPSGVLGFFRFCLGSAGSASKDSLDLLGGTLRWILAP